MGRFWRTLVLVVGVAGVSAGCEPPVETYPVCGDGAVEGFEGCDDGNGVNTDSCPDGPGGTCQKAYCGDGVILAGVETCDDGDTINNGEGRCLANCSGEQKCGDGVMEGTEGCDDEGESETCNANCSVAVCGDAIINVTAGEGCDDGDTVSNGEGRCPADCSGMQICGDGTKAGTEECDDGDKVNTDDCPDGAEADCKTAVCGDGFVHDGVEVCDDGDTESNGEGECVADCTAIQECGNGATEGTEGCDGAGESSTCNTNCTVSVCGDWIFNATAGEVCDEGTENGTGVGYCKPDCLSVESPPGMVAVPGGDFISGDSCGVNTGTTCLTPKTRTTGPFYIDIHEVTAGEYKVCVNTGPCEYNGSTDSPYRTYDNNKENHPISFVSWREAKKYCEWKEMRLPTEIEWEKAARGTDGRKYPWGTADPTCVNTVMKEGAASGDEGCGEDSTWEVGKKPAGKSPYGAYDMAGNVFEWTDSLHLLTGGDPVSGLRVLRGGSFNLNMPFLASTWRGGHYPTYRPPTQISGFRCASTGRTPSPAPTPDP